MRPETNSNLHEEITSTNKGNSIVKTIFSPDIKAYVVHASGKDHILGTKKSQYLKNVEIIQHMFPNCNRIRKEKQILEMHK